MPQPRSALAVAALALALASSASAGGGGTPPRGKFTKDKKDKDEWRDALNSWQAKENQEFMQEYDEQQQEREEVRFCIQMKILVV